MWLCLVYHTTHILLRKMPGLLVKLLPVRGRMGKQKTITFEEMAVISPDDNMKLELKEEKGK